ncbi:WD40 repeat-like protein, partial [Coprinellus micaceus]
MPFTPYRVLLNCPKESVNRVAFSSDTKLLASGGDDGCLCIHAFRLPSSYPLKAEYPAAITSLKWIPGTHRLFVGLSCGSVHLLSIDDTVGQLVDVRVAHVSPHDISSLALDWRRKQLGVASGSIVYVFDLSRMKEGICRQIMAIRPGRYHGENFNSSTGPDRWEIQDIHFIDRGARMLIAYLGSGVRMVNMDTLREDNMDCLLATQHVGVCAIDKTETYMAVFNFRDGFDFYDIREDRFLGSVELELRQHVAVQACFLSEAGLVVLGASDGKVKVVTVPGLREVDCLDHGEDIIQALNYCPELEGDSPGYIVTACAEKGTETYVKIWKFQSAASTLMGVDNLLNTMSQLRSLGVRPFLHANCSLDCAQQHRDSFILGVIIFLVFYFTRGGYWWDALSACWDVLTVQLRNLLNCGTGVLKDLPLQRDLGLTTHWSHLAMNLQNSLRAWYATIIAIPGHLQHAIVAYWGFALRLRYV